MADLFEIRYKPTFVRRFKKLSNELQEEILETIEALKDRKRHERLRVHKLTGKLKNYHSCSVNFKYRMVFLFEEKHIIVLADVGDHDVYK
jgi:addiction module RelE/StbE family toxin